MDENMGAISKTDHLWFIERLEQHASPEQQELVQDDLDRLKQLYLSYSDELDQLRQITESYTETRQNIRTKLRSQQETARKQRRTKKNRKRGMNE